MDAPLPPGSKSIEEFAAQIQRQPLLWSTMLHNGGYHIEIDKANRQIVLSFYPTGMPFIKLLVIPMPSLAFIQFAKAVQQAIDSLQENTNEESQSESNTPS